MLKKFVHLFISLMVLVPTSLNSSLPARGVSATADSSVIVSNHVVFGPISQIVKMRTSSLPNPPIEVAQTSKTHDSVTLSFTNPGIALKATQIVSGSNHTCALLEDKTIKCWGAGFVGQLGDGSSLNSPNPVSVAGISTATQVTAGAYHTCALLEDKTIKCWGSVSSGQLGNGDGTDQHTPVSVVGISTATQVTAGAGHTCALLEDKTIKCWGSNGGGKLGVTGVSSSAMPINVQAITNAVQVTAGSDHTCALLEDKTIKCWGYNIYGQLGNGTTSSSPIPRGVSQISTATQVTAGAYHTCALLEDKTIKCWGSGSSGQLGSDYWSSSNNFKSISPVSVSQISTATQVTAGAAHTCAVLENKTIECWGNGVSGQLGYGNTFNIRFPHSVSQISTATQVTAGVSHTCALVEDRSIKCWGGRLYLNSSFIGSQSTIPITVGDDFASIEKFKVEWSENGTTWQSLETIDTSATISGLAGGASYQVRVSAHTAAGWGATSSPIAMETIDPPSPPLQLTKSNITASSVDLTWLTPYANELSVDKYKVEWSTNGSTWQSLETQDLQTSITGLSSATSYQVRVKAYSLAGYGEASQIIYAATTGTRSMRFNFKLADGRPLTGGAVSWALNDESYSSATNYGVPSTGVLDFPRVAAGTGTITVNNLQSPTGESISFTRTIELGQTIHNVTVPAATDKGSYKINVKLPNGEPVLGASVSVTGLDSYKAVEEIAYNLPSASSGSTNDQGWFQASGFVTGTPRAKVTYNDGVLVQTKFVDLTSASTNVVLDEMPWLEVNESAQTVSSGALVNVPVSLKGVSSKSGYTLSITAPSGSSQTCKGRVLSAKTNSSGKATLKVCANKSGTYKVKTKGAVSTGVVQLKVKNAAPLPVTGVTAKSTSLGSATVSWSAPSYTGGASIKGYKVIITGGGKTYTKTTTSRSHTFTGLKNATQYTVTVEATTKHGSSTRVTVKVGVA